MEVHHHSHSARKKWTHYFWEFLMLFLAVFCGFLAENQREHLIEHRREVQFMRTLKEDLGVDIVQVRQQGAEPETTILTIDKIMSRSAEILSANPSLETIKKVSKIIGFPDFVYTDRTIQQLKNAGNMRLIRKAFVADSITVYDGVVRRALIHQDMLNQIAMTGYINKLKQLVNLNLLLKLRAGTFNPAEWESDQKLIFLDRDRVELSRLLNELLFYKVGLQVHLANIREILIHAEGLNDFVTEKYQL